MWATVYYRIISERPTRPNSVFDVEIEPTLVPPITTSSTSEPFTSRPNPPGSFFLTIGAPPSSGTFFPNNNCSGTSFLDNSFFNIGAPALNNPFLPSNRPSNPTFETSVTSNVIASGNTVQTSVTPDDKTAQQCGGSSVNVQPLVVNGDSVEEGELPWMVAIMYRINQVHNYGCTGNLVTNKHVITAAHCVQYLSAPLVPVEDLLIVFGKVDLRNWKDGAITRNVQNLTVHPDHKQDKGDGDVAVLTLEKSVDFEDFIQPICLWQEDDDLDIIVGETGTIAGWGRDESGQNFVVDAKKIHLPIVSQVTCLRSDPDFSDITSTRTFCAGKLDGSGPCTGDSGAGFAMRRNGRWTLRGVVSVSLKDTGTCAVSKYSVFVDLAKFKIWLANTVV
ncbi:hypothetical protein ILUMI_09201 [Ignelater luminosus]|uniref:Peptidase S1 domain-containing protein n=1 Tax=Ignelater luminosus TaxID=2038154 RepID=A0A8K0D2W1_IGNLU|nr:hypothetical protein ILUMI_09201 [Ignelater luminosus]